MSQPEGKEIWGFPQSFDLWLGFHRWVGGLKVKCQNDVLYGIVNMDAYT